VRVVLAPGFVPHAKQLPFINSTARFEVVAAGIRGGKTMGATVKTLRRIYQDLADGKGKKPSGTGRRRQPRLLYWAVAPTSQHTVHVHRYVTQFCPPELIERIYEDAIWLRPDILIELKTAERPDLLVGASVNGALVDEACRCKAGTWPNIRGRLADTGGWCIFASSPLGGRNNWVYQEVVSKVGIDPHVASFWWRTEDNPYIPREEVDHARATQPAAWFKRDWEASWDSFGGAIYEEFRDEIHVTDEQRFRFEFGLGNRPLRECFNRVISIIDFGHVANGCMLTIGELGDRNWVVLEEVYGPGIRPISGSSRTWLGECQRVGRDLGVREFFGDPEDAGALFDLRNNGVPIRAANKQVYTGIRRVASAIHVDDRTRKPGLRIFKNCVNTIREIRNYQWKPNREQTGFLEEPAPNQDDHAMDCLRYGAMELKLYDYVDKARGMNGNGDASTRMGQ